MSIAQRARLAAADPLLARLERIEQRVRALEGRQRVRDARHAAALTALAAAVSFRTFTAVSALQHAHQADPALLAALTAAGVDTARPLGRWLRTLQHTPVHGLRLERTGTSSDGALWVVRAAD